MPAVGLSLPGLVLMASGLVLSYAAVADPEGGPVGVVRDVLSGKVPTPGPQKVTPVKVDDGAGGGTGTFVPRTVGDGKYNLGPVKPHVAAAARTYGIRFGIDDIGGFGPGSVSGSDHPRGLALDFMVSASKEQAKGDALAAALLADPSVTYVIWNRKINTKNGKGWRAYFGPSAHTDHVHASFKG
jgi:hypothetical protein